MIYIVLFHLNICRNGYIGVDVLFIISGFLVMNKYQNDNIDYLKFISNRLIRIYPLLYFTLLFCLYLFRNEESEKLLELINEVKYCISFISNYYYQIMEKDYFHPSKSAVFLNTWAVCLEMQYYCFCSIFIIHQKVNIIVTILSIIYYICKNTAIYYSLLGRLYQFNIGIIIYKHRSYTKYSYYNKSLLLISLFLFPYNKFYKFSHLYSTIFASSFIYYNLNDYHCNIFDHVGDISYGIYLFHFPLLYIITGSVKYILVLYLYSYILSKIDSNLYKYFQNKRVFTIICFILSFIICLTIVTNMKQNIIRKINALHIDSIYTIIPLSSYKCHINNLNYNSILIIGDSHSLPIISMIYKYCKKYSILIYYKCIHTTYIVFSQYSNLYDVNMNFSVIILTHHYSSIDHSNSTNLIEKVVLFLVYLKTYSSYIIYILPTPHLLHSISCKNQLDIMYAERDIDVDVNYINVEKMKRIRNVIILNFTNFYCNNTYCNLTYSNKCLYLDNNHLSKEFFIYLTPYVIKYINYYKFKNNKKSKLFYNNSYILLNNKMDKLWKIPTKNCKINYIDVPY